MKPNQPIHSDACERFTVSPAQMMAHVIVRFGSVFGHSPSDRIADTSRYLFPVT